jgi:multiple sugar transport system substrate-binding protein
MREILASVVEHWQDQLTFVRSLLPEFEAQTGIHASLYVGEMTRSGLQRLTISGKGPDVTEVVTTWVHDLVGMNSLRLFSDKDLARIGRPEEFLPGIWNTCHLAGSDEVWSIPWMTEAVVIHYRRDLLEKAGVDEKTAFTSLQSLHATAQALQKVGVSMPVELPYRARGYDQLHALSGWLWSYGADYVSPDGRQVIFDEPAALAAMCDYFSLLKYSSPQACWQQLQAQDTQFHQGRSAILFCYHQYHWYHKEVPPEVAGSWAIAPYPDKKYLGGSNMVIWKHSRMEEEALEWVNYFTSTPVVMEFVRRFHQLPARVALLDAPEITQDPALYAAAQAARDGRSYLAVPLWGLIEERLIRAFEQIQTELLKNPQANVEEIVRGQIIALAHRLNLTLSR